MYWLLLRGVLAVQVYNYNASVNESFLGVKHLTIYLDHDQTGAPDTHPTRTRDSRSTDMHQTRTRDFRSTDMHQTRTRDSRSIDMHQTRTRYSRSTDMHQTRTRDSRSTDMRAQLMSGLQELDSLAARHQALHYLTLGTN